MTEERQQQQPVYVGFWVRFIAFLIDSTAASFLIAPIAVIVLGSDVELDYGDIDHLRNQLTGILAHMSVEMILMGIIFVLFWIYLAATPGKMIFKAYIVDANSGRRASNLQLVIRYLGYFISLFALGLGFLWIAVDRRKQGWHDKIAGTVVVKGLPAEEAADAGHT